MALDQLHRGCPTTPVRVLSSRLDACQQVALSSGADAFISKDEAPERVTERLRSVTASAGVNWDRFSNAGLSEFIPAFHRRRQVIYIQKSLNTGRSRIYFPDQQTLSVDRADRWALCGRGPWLGQGNFEMRQTFYECE
jgi:DNA-binding NarL/FixJ family response regulator